jgi:chromosome partitioning protein
METKIIATTNLKGGVGKTTTVANLGAALARLGYKVLLIDWDPQFNLTTHFGFDPESKDLLTLFGIFDKEHEDYYDVKKLKPYSIEHYNDRLFLLPNNYKLAQFEGMFTGVPAGDMILKDVLSNFRGKVDYILIDCQPSLSILTINAYFASDFLIVPMSAGKFSENGIDRIVKTLRRIEKTVNQKIKIAGAFFGRHSPGTVISKTYLKHFEEDKMEIPLMKTFIRENVAVQECQEMGVDIFKYDSLITEEKKKLTVSNGSEDYYNLANELLYLIGDKAEFDTAREQVESNGSAKKKSLKGDLKSDFESFLKG